MILASIVGAFINVLPYFFYDLTELKQQGMIRVLKIRAFFEDFGNNTLSDENLVEVVEMVDQAKKLEGAKEIEVNDDELKAAKASKSKAAVKAAKKHKKEIAAQNQEIKLAPFVLKEMSKFESELGKRQIADANMIYNAGLAGLGTYSVKELRENLRKAKALPKNTEEEKEMRQYAIHFCRTRLTARKYQKKYYGDKTMEVPDNSKLNALFNTEEGYDEQEQALYQQLFEAQEAKDAGKKKAVKAELKVLKNKFKQLNKDIHEEQNHHVNFNRSAKPYLDARNLLKQAENYTHFAEIQERYKQIKESAATVEA